MQQKRVFYGWSIVGVTFLIGITQAGVFQNVLSIFLKPMAAEFGWNRSMITGSIAIGSLAGGIISPFIGPYLDRYGSRMIAFWSITVLSAGLIALSQLSQIWQLYLFFGTGRMIASGILSLVVTVSVSNWFIEKRGRAMGISQLGSRIGIAFLPLLVQMIIITWGWRTAWAVLGMIVFSLSAVPSILFLKRRPEDVGLLPDGKTVPDEPVAAETDNAQKAPALENEPVWDRKSVFRTRAFWMLLFVMCVIFFVGAGINFHLFPFLTDHGIRPEIAVLAITTLSISSAFGGVLLGFLAERIAVKKLLGIILIINGLLFYSIFLMVQNLWLMFGTCLVYGLFRGGVLPLVYLVWTEFFGRLSSGTVLGLTSPFRMTANAAGPVFAAVCFDLFEHYYIPFTLFTALLIAGGAVSFIARPPVSPNLKAGNR